MKKTSLLIVFAAFSIITIAQNKIIESVANIKSVTIYNSSAEINYQKEMLLPKGKSTVIFTNLTPFIVENTFNVSLSNPAVDIITVTEKINYVKEKNEHDDVIAYLRDSVNLMKSKLGLLKSTTEALRMEKSLLFKDESLGGVSKGVPVAEIEKASTFFNKRYIEINETLFRLTEKEKVLNKNLLKYNKQINELSANTMKAASEIMITVFNPSPQKVKFSFKFLTPKGGWAPAYDCKYEGPGNPIKFIFRANVFNASGKAWENVEIKLSTASPTTGFDTPTLKEKKGNKLPIKNDGEVKFKNIEVRNTVAEYSIKHNYTIPSDSKPYLIDVNSYQMKASYHYLLIPKVDPFGFLIANIPDWNKYDLIPGTTNIYNKGSYMGKTFLNTYAENDTLSLYLGKDNNIIAVKKEKNSNNQQKIIGNYYVDKAAVNIVVKNNSSETLSIKLLDQVPVFKIGEKIKFNLHDVEQADYDNKEGSLTWNFKLSQNESKIIDYKFEIKIPKNDIGDYKPRKRRFRTISSPSF